MKRVLDLNALKLPELFDALVQDESLEQLIRAARDEDLGSAGDITSASVIEPAQRGRGVLAARQDGVVCGQYLAEPILSVFSADVLVEWRVFDGDCCEKGSAIAILNGRLRDLLAIERTLLNFVCHLSGIATLTRRFVEAIKGTRAVICDTRKTTPGLRGLEKYAVRCGGGTLHRVGLFDAALFKDNHLAAIERASLARVLTDAAKRARAARPIRFVEVEADSIDTLKRLLAIPAGTIDMVLLDNMSIDMLREAVALRDRLAPAVRLEASGGVTLDSVRAIAETGVNRISVGGLTHSSPALDIGLDISESAGDGG